MARALALVCIASGAAFVHWANHPLASLASPKGLPAAQTAGEQPSPNAPDKPHESGDGTNTQQDQPPPSDTRDDPPKAAPFDPSQLDTEIDTQQTYQLWQLGTVTFIDAREPDEYHAGHIPFAFLVPAEGDRVTRLGDLIAATGIGPAQRIVVYCEGGTCSASELVALDLQDMGFTKIHIDTGGFPAWQAAGYEVETGPDQMLGDPQ